MDASDLPDALKGWHPVSRIPEHLRSYLDQYAETRDIWIHMKWTLDGVATLVDAAVRLHAYARDLEDLAALGFELRDQIDGGHGSIGRPEDDGPIYPDDDDGDEPIAS